MWLFFWEVVLAPPLPHAACLPPSLPRGQSHCPAGGPCRVPSGARDSAGPRPSQNRGGCCHANRAGEEGGGEAPSGGGADQGLGSRGSSPPSQHCQAVSTLSWLLGPSPRLSAPFLPGWSRPARPDGYMVNRGMWQGPVPRPPAPSAQQTPAETGASGLDQLPSRARSAGHLLADARWARGASSRPVPPSPAALTSRGSQGPAAAPLSVSRGDRVCVRPTQRQHGKQPSACHSPAGRATGPRPGPQGFSARLLTYPMETRAPCMAAEGTAGSGPAGTQAAAAKCWPQMLLLCTVTSVDSLSPRGCARVRRAPRTEDCGSRRPQSELSRARAWVTAVCSLGTGAVGPRPSPSLQLSRGTRLWGEEGHGHPGPGGAPKAACLWSGCAEGPGRAGRPEAAPGANSRLRLSLRARPPSSLVSRWAWGIPGNLGGQGLSSVTGSEWLCLQQCEQKPVGRGAHPCLPVAACRRGIAAQATGNSGAHWAAQTAGTYAVSVLGAGA